MGPRCKSARWCSSQTISMGTHREICHGRRCSPAGRAMRRILDAVSRTTNWCRKHVRDGAARRPREGNWNRRSRETIAARAARSVESTVRQAVRGNGSDLMVLRLVSRVPRQNVRCVRSALTARALPAPSRWVDSAMVTGLRVRSRYWNQPASHLHTFTHA